MQARADKEQSRFLKGSWDWKSNKGGVQSFMQEGANRSKNWSTIYTLGMRGSGDAASATLTAAALEEVIAWQQSALTKALGKPLPQIPQTWVMYKVRCQRSLISNMKTNKTFRKYQATGRKV